jgi:Xaa-Pro aminopeptidase
MLARANEANRAMYDHARKIVRPGINELEIYSELQAVTVRTLGEPPTYFGQDFRSGERGGAPRDRKIQAGELMILDLGVGFRGYHSDNARTIAVGGEPSDKQQQAWKAAASIFDLVQSQARPGASCHALFDEAQKQLDKYLPGVFNHHLGHGVGLAPQEGPHLTPRWEDALAEGDFIAVEPGLYHEDLHSGVRLEQNYLVTATGVELMTDWPLGL